MMVWAALGVIAAQGQWLSNPDEAREPAKKARRPILLVTICAPPG